MEAILTFRTYKQVCCPPPLLVLISCFPTITHVINVSWFFMLSVVRYNSRILVKLSYSYLPWKIFKSTCQTTIDQMNVCIFSWIFFRVIRTVHIQYIQTCNECMSCSQLPKEWRDIQVILKKETKCTLFIEKLLETIINIIYIIHVNIT